MKVAVDVSIASVCSEPTVVKAGIYRVVERLLSGLVVHPEVSLSLAATYHYRYISDYLNARPTFSKVPLLVPTEMHLKTLKLGEMFSSKVHETGIQIANLKERGERALLQKILRQIYYKCAFETQAINLRTYNSSIATADKFLSSDIFHSTFYPIPESIVAAKSIKKAINVYDIIPMLFPQNAEGESFLVSMLRELSQETLIFTISNCAKDDICNFSSKISPDRVVVTYLAASDSFYQCTDTARVKVVRKKYNVPDSPYVMCLCTFEPRKNLEFTIKAFAKLVQQEKIDDLNLVLVGGKGWKYSSIFDTLQSCGLEESRIIVTGYVDEEDLAPLYSGAMAFVFPSIYEGFGLPPLEAMQCGVPVITSNTSSLPEVVGDAGIMVGPNDSDAFCQAIFDLYSDRSLRDALSLKSKQRAELFKWSKFIDETVAGYQHLLSGKVGS